MTRHVSEDELIQLALGLLDTQVEESVRRHIGGCAACRGVLTDVERTLNQIKDVAPHVTADIPLLPSPGHLRYRWVRMAAVLAVAFGLGFIASEALRPPPLNVVHQQLVPRSPVRPAAGFVVCDEIDLSWSAR